MGVWYTLWFGFLFAAAVVRVYRREIGPRLAVARRLRRAQRTLEDGAVVTLTGTVREHREHVTAPLSGKKAVAYAVRAFWHSGRRGESDEMLIVRGMVAFVLETNDGPVTVEGSEADIEFRPAAIIPRSIARERAFLAAHARSIGNRNMSFDEIHIEPGMKVSVHGVVRVEHDFESRAESDYREGAPRRTVVHGHPQHPLTIGKPRR